LRSRKASRILVINCGSSSVKYGCFDDMDQARAIRGVVERVGSAQSRMVHRAGLAEMTFALPQGGYEEALEAILKAIQPLEGEGIGEASGINLFAHRVVHGGEVFTAPVIVDDSVLRRLETMSSLAPLHNPVNLAGIVAAMRVFPSVPHVAVFDTAFHRSLPARAFLYGLPYELYETQRIRRYGFHGTSHAYACLAGAAELGRRPEDLKIITCHLGSGASVCAVDRGRSVDTSMGFTPTEGLVMATRCGDLDPAVVGFLQQTLGLNSQTVSDLLNKRSGMLGLTGLGSDMKEIERQAEAGHERAALALDLYAYRLKKYVGAYAAAMGGVDLVVFTGGVGQGSAWIRREALSGLEFMGIHLDQHRNERVRGHHEVCRITTDDSSAAVLIVPADEEWMMACEAVRAVRQA
jgi:acetate kinase